MGVEHYLYNKTNKKVFSLGKLICGIINEATEQTLEEEVLDWLNSKNIEESIDKENWAKEISEGILSTVGLGDDVAYFDDSSCQWENHLEYISDYVVAGSVYKDDDEIGKTIYDLFCHNKNKIEPYGLDCREEIAHRMLNATENAIEEAYQEVSMESTVRESVTRDYEFLKQKGNIIDYQIESIDVSDPREPKVVVNMTLNKPVDNIKFDFKIDDEEGFMESVIHNW